MKKIQFKFWKTMLFLQTALVGALASVPGIAQTTDPVTMINDFNATTKRTATPIKSLVLTIMFIVGVAMVVPKIITALKKENNNSYDGLFGLGVAIIIGVVLIAVFSSAGGF